MGRSEACDATDYPIVEIFLHRRHCGERLMKVSTQNVRALSSSRSNRDDRVRVHGPPRRHSPGCRHGSLVGKGRETNALKSGHSRSPAT